MELFELFILGLFSSLTSSAPQKKTTPKFPYPILNVDDWLPYHNATPAYTFEGVDYDALPDKLRKDHYDCHTELMRCIRNRTYLHHICSFAEWYKFGSYYTMCQLELMNCGDRVRSGLGLYGKYYADDGAWFQGEGVDCVKSQSAYEGPISNR